MTENGWKWLDMAGNDWNSWKWLEMAGNIWKWLKIARAQRDSIRSQTFHSKGTAYDNNKYETFPTKYGIVCPFKRTFGNSRWTAYHVL